MVSPNKKLLELAKKGRKVIAPRSRRSSFSTCDGASDSNGCSTSVVERGHFVVYSIDGIRCVLPLASLDSPIFTELLEMSEEEFGLPSEGPITLPCSGVFLEYVASMIKRSMSKDVEREHSWLPCPPATTALVLLCNMDLPINRYFSKPSKILEAP
ncbi:hypothetical protein ACLOJK_002311 [Asimina triloba]